MLNEAELLGSVRKYMVLGSRKQPCTAIVLFHVPAEGGRPDPIEDWDPEDQSKPPDVVAQEISAKAREDAREGHGEQHYVVGFFFGEAAKANARSGGNYGARFRFSIDAGPSFESSGDGPELSPELAGSNRATGILATKFSNDLAKLTIPWANQLMAAQQNTIMRLEAQVNELMAERRRNIILHEKLASQAHKRALQMRKTIFWEKQKEEVASIVFPMIGPIMASLAGRPMLPTAPTDETKAFEKFAETLTDEQLSQLQMKLKPHQLPAVFQIVSAVKNKQAVPNVILREFVKSIDEAQMEDFKQVLTGEQHQDLLMIVVGYMEKYKQMQQEAKSAIEGEGEEEEPEDPEAALNEDASFY